MNKAFSYTGIFVGGFVACALALKTMGDPSSLFPGGASHSKQAVLTALNTTPRPEAHFAGDSVVADAAAKLQPTIVEIHTIGKPVQQASASPFGNDPVFRRFFGGGGGEAAPVTPQGAGSGVIISSDGYIMTNDHVVADTSTVKVSIGTDQSKEYTARVIGTDPVSDIAVIKINPTTPLTPATLGDSDDVRVGDWAIAVGNPLDVGETVTLGIISAKNRTSDASGAPLGAEGRTFSGSRLQTDAAINPGNSGGALADINGRVVGINEAIESPNGSGSVGIGFAIPINDAKKIAAELIQDGKVVRPYLGVSYKSLKDFTEVNERRQYGLPLDSDQGAVVQGVYPNSPAATAGLKQGDLITSVDGKTIQDLQTLQNAISAKSIGQTLTLQVSRKGQPRTVTVTLRERPDSFGQEPQQPQQMAPQQMAPQDNPFGP
jgi:S1-C subfamily serine protease